MKLNFVRSLLAEQFEAHKITDFTSLDHFLRHYVRAGTFSERHASTVLKDSIQRFETEFKISFYKELLPKIIQWSVCDEPLYVDLLEQGIDAETKLSETEVVECLDSRILLVSLRLTTLLLDSFSVGECLFWQPDDVSRTERQINRRHAGC
jgi:hypothetical protein